VVQTGKLAGTYGKTGVFFRWLEPVLLQTAQRLLPVSSWRDVSEGLIGQMQC